MKFEPIYQLSFFHAEKRIKGNKFYKFIKFDLKQNTFSDTMKFIGFVQYVTAKRFGLTN